MQDKEFVALSPAEAYDYAVQQSPEERVRLLKLYRNVRGVEAQRNMAAPPGAAPSQSAESLARLGAPKSLMLTAGRIGFAVCAVGLLINLLLVLSGDAGFIATVAFGILASGMGLFVLMWMLGALEMRLIELAVILRSKS